MLSYTTLHPTEKTTNLHPKEFLIEVENTQALLSHNNDNDNDNDEEEGQQTFENNQQVVAQRFVEFFATPTRTLQTHSLDFLNTCPFQQTINGFSLESIYEALDTIFTLAELKSVVQLLNSASAPAEDGFTYSFVTNLHDDALARLLNVYNLVWQTGDYPHDWKTSIIKPVPKPNKSPFKLANYRPIVLHSVLAKVMEKMVHARLTWLMEAVFQNTLDPFQFAFRNNVSCDDLLRHIALAYTQAKRDKQQLFLLKVDIENAFPTVNHNLINELLNKIIPLPSTHHSSPFRTYIMNFLQQQSIKVLCNGFSSHEHTLTTGIKQGSPLSPLLFRLALAGLQHLVTDINSSLRKQHSHVQILVYADDIFVLIATNLNEFPKVTKCINTITQRVISWLAQRYFKVNQQKLQLISLHPPNTSQQTIILADADDDDDDGDSNNTQLSLSNTIVVLGATLDTGLSFEPHINNLIASITTWINILKFLASKKINVKAKTLLQVYKAAIRPRIESTGIFFLTLTLRFSFIHKSFFIFQIAIFYSFATQTLLHKLDIQQNNALRIILGAFRTTPVTHLQMLTGITELSTRRDRLQLQYANKCTSMRSSHPTSIYYANTHQVVLLDYDKLAVKFGLQRSEFTLLQKSSLGSSFLSPPWTVKPLNIDLFMRTVTNDPSILPNWYKFHFNAYIHTTYLGYDLIFTDGSLTTNNITKETQAAFAVYDLTTNQVLSQQRLPRHHSAFSAEFLAIRAAFLALRNKNRHVCIVTDSLSTCTLLANPHTLLRIASFANHSLLNPTLSYLTHPSVQDIFDINNSYPKNITIVWAPAHCGILGNERADIFAKDAINPKQLSPKALPELYDPNEENFQEEYLNQGLFLLADRPNLPKKQEATLTTHDFNVLLRQQERRFTLKTWKNIQNKRKGPQQQYSFLIKHIKNVQWFANFDNFPRYIQKKLFRLASEHTNLTHKHLFERPGRNTNPSNTTTINTAELDDTVFCQFCLEHEPPSVRHLINECVNFNATRGTISIENNLFGTEQHIKQLINFLKSENLFELL